MNTVAFIVSGKSPKTIPGGLGAYSYNVAKILNDLGYKVYIIGFSAKNEIVDLDFATLIHFKNPYSRLLGLGAILSASLFVKKMEEVIRRELPQNIIVYSSGIWGVAGIALRKRLKRRNINIKAIAAYFTTHKHEYQGHLKGAPVKDYGLFSHLMIRMLYVFARIIYSPVEKRMLVASDIIVIHYNSSYDILVNEFPSLDRAKIIKIPYYIDIYTRTSGIKFTSKATSATSLLTVSVLCRQDPRKGINTFLKAVKILKEQGIKFNCLIVGTGIFLKQNKRLALKLGLADDINFMGFVDSVESVLENTDIYVLPSFEEGAGAISLLEAMKKGVAIVTTKCDGIPEDIIDGQTAILVEIGDEQKLADAIALLLKDNNLRESLARNVKFDYDRRFTFDKMKKGVADLMM